MFPDGNYLTGKLRNDLRSVSKNLEALTLILSHADSDHWRIIGWDSEILGKIKKIFIPNGAISLAFYDRAVFSKIAEIGHNLELKLTARTTLNILRSSPAISDRNSTCLVSVFKRGQKLVLAPGDYVYGRFSTDHNKAINSLHNYRYSAVIVPHHGDKASAFKVVRPALNGVAFFSAGTHKSYKHPTGLSLHAHANAEFSLIVNNAIEDIKVLRLL